MAGALSLRRVTVLAGATLLVLLALAGPARAADPAEASITGPCTLNALSEDGAGGELDELEGPGVADPMNPFDIASDGRVGWTGTGPAVTSGTYSVSIYGVPVPFLSGDVDNPEGRTEADGVIVIGDILPIDVVGTFEVSGSISGDGGSCSGSAWVRLDGEPLTSVPGLVGIGAAVVGLLGVLTSIKGAHPWRGLFAGLLLGVGAGILAIVFGVVPIGALTPLVLAFGGGIVGLLLGLAHIGGAPAV